MQPVIAETALAETELAGAETVGLVEAVEVRVVEADSCLMWEASSGGYHWSPLELLGSADYTDWFHSLLLYPSHPQCISACYR